MSHQDWTPVVFAQNNFKKKTAVEKRMASRRGKTTIVAKRKDNSKIHKLENETENKKHEKISVHFGKALMQARMAAHMTQKVLAQKLNVKSTIIQNYEKAKGHPNQQLIRKLERALNCKLPRNKKK
jgi:ribosome-binding protein aMBF1 (putative translation factor)